MTATRELTISVENMSCASCAVRVERALTALPEVRAANVNFAAGTARLTLDGPIGLAGVRAALEAAGYPAREVETVLTVEGMSCASCVGRVERALTALPGMREAAVNLAAGEARLRHLEGTPTPEAMIRAVAETGYTARTADEGGAARQAASDRRAAEARETARHALMAGALTLPVVVMEMGGMLIPAFGTAIEGALGRWALILQFLLVTLAMAGPGRGFYRRGVPALARGAPDMDSLVALGTAAAWGYSTVATFAPALLPEAARAVYFEAAGVIVTLILAGRWMEARAKGRTGRAIEALMDLAPRTARVIRGGEAVEVPAAELALGDMIELRPGERAAADGEVIAGTGRIDESMITGEPAPVAKAPGDRVTGGTVAGAGSLRFRAEAVGADTTLSEILRMVEAAQGAKLPIQSLVDRVTLWFVPAVLAAAAVTVAVWLAIGPAPALTHALVAGVSVLIIACPCAMGLATPTSIMVGTGRAARMGVLFRKGDALQKLSGVRRIAFDKTGTLTEGRPEMTDLVLAEGSDRGEMLRAAAALESRSEHPLAGAILRAACAEGAAGVEPESFATITGHGLSGRVAGRDVLVGAARLMAREGVDITALEPAAKRIAERGRGAILVAIDGRAAGVIGVADPLRPGAGEAVAALHRAGLETAMITGDRAETAQAMAREAGIEHVVAGVPPEGKVAALSSIPGEGPLAFVGDGINDAPALAEADVGIALGTGTDVAIEAGEVVLMAGDPRGVATALALSRATMRNIRQNLVWAFGYNTALIPVAAGALYPAFGVLLSPMLAAGAMALSSVFVVSNALRLGRVRLNQSAGPAPSPAPAAAVQPAPAE